MQNTIYIKEAIYLRLFLKIIFLRFIVTELISLRRVNRNLVFIALMTITCMLVAACTKKCDSTLGASVTGKHFQLMFDSTNYFWASEGSWQQAGNNVLINAKGFGSSAFTKISIAYSATDTDSLLADNASVVKIMPGKLVYTSTINEEISNTTIAYLEVRQGSIKDSRMGKLLAIPLSSPTLGQVLLSANFMVCKQ
jgi:hypothetical protein